MVHILTKLCKINVKCVCCHVCHIQIPSHHILFGNTPASPTMYIISGYRYSVHVKKHRESEKVVYTIIMLLLTHGSYKGSFRNNYWEGRMWWSDYFKDAPRGGSHF